MSGCSEKSYYKFTKYKRRFVAWSRESERERRGAIDCSIRRGCLLSRYICAFIVYCRILYRTHIHRRKAVSSVPSVIERETHPCTKVPIEREGEGKRMHQIQIHPKVHYYPCIVLLNIDSIAFE